MILRRRIWPLCLNQGWLLLAALLVLINPSSQGRAQDAIQSSKFADVAGNIHLLPADSQSIATVFIFLQPDCPISNQYAPKVHQLQETFQKRQIRFFRIYADKDVTAEAIAKHTKDYQYEIPAFRDPEHHWTRLTGATVTPEVVVFDREGRRVYRGRIDNRYVDFGQKRQQATQHDLQLALKAILAGQAPDPAETTAVGCYIP